MATHDAVREFPALEGRNYGSERLCNHPVVTQLRKQRFKPNIFGTTALAL